jgi:hypothetical protein
MSSIEEEIDAILTPWVPSPPTESALERYLSAWEAKIRPFSSAPDFDVAAYRASIERHCNRMREFLASDRDSFQCLALGEVQSGKTGHLTASICWAASNDIDLVIVMSGTKLSLMNQTRKRLAKEIPSGVVNMSVIQPSYEDHSRAALVGELHPLLQARMRGESSTLPLLVAPKVSRRLDQLVEIVSALDELTPENSGLNILVIDDEGDEASADTTASQRGRTARARRFANRAQVRRAVHSCIADLRRQATSKLIYLSYTATPQALLLGELDGILQPQFCTTVPSGTSYFGLDDAVRDPDVFEAVPLSWVPQHADPQQDIYVALEVAFAEFLVQAWLHYAYRAFFHSGLDGVPACTSSGVQMLVHPSAVQNPHRQYQQYLENLRDDWLRALNDHGRRVQLQNEFLRPAFVRVLERFPQSVRQRHGVSGGQMNDFLQFAYETISDENHLQVWEINSREFTRRLRTQEGREALPTEEEEWQGPRAMVLVGGNLLGRGITIPHLVTSFFLRDPQEPNFDTTTQQMRFCGYRRSYSRSIRIFAPQTLLDIYQDIADTDAPFRARASDWDRLSVDLHANPPVSRFVVPAGSRLNLTRSNVISGDVSGFDTGASNRSGAFSSKHIASIARLAINAATLQRSFGQLVPEDQRWVASEGWNINSYRLSPMDLRTLLATWSLHPTDKEGPGVLYDLLYWPRSHGGLGQEQCVVLVDEPLLSYPSARVLWQTMMASQGQGWMKRTVGLPHGYQQSYANLVASPSATEELITVPTIVGGSERTAREPWSDCVLLHFRAYGLRKSEGDAPDAYGISMIGWVPDNSSVFSVNLEAAGLFDAQG